MFKKLFIGLLILSTLVSEGVVNLPANVYKLYCESNNTNGSNQVSAGTKTTTPVLWKQVQESRVLLKGLLLSDRSFAMSSNSIQKFKFKAIPVDFYYGDRSYLPYNSIVVQFVPFIKPDKTAILSGSDVSPPYYNI